MLLFLLLLLPLLLPCSLLAAANEDEQYTPRLQAWVQSFPREQLFVMQVRSPATWYTPLLLHRAGGSLSLSPLPTRLRAVPALRHAVSPQMPLGSPPSRL